MNSTLDLGVAGFSALPGLSAETWARVHESGRRGRFLRSEGMVVDIGPPQRMDPAFRDRVQRLVREFGAFADDLAGAYYRHPERRDEHLVEPLMEPLIELDRDVATAVPLARLDCALDSTGRLKVIEINPVGVCAYHYRNTLYMVRALDRVGAHDAAKALDATFAPVAESVLRYYRARSARPQERPCMGVLALPRSVRAAHRLYRAAFARHGIDTVWGTGSDVSVTAAGISVAGTRVDLLWSDFYFYIAYQQQRYAETKFPSKLDIGTDSVYWTRRLLDDPQFIDHLRAGTVVNIGPGSSYLVLPKPLLSRVHGDRPASMSEPSPWLRDHVARTYSVRDRQHGVIERGDVIADRGQFVLKPANYGGSHDVTLGCDMPADQWTALVDSVWERADWALQEYIEPASTRTGEWLSVGVPCFGGLSGGALLRTAPQRTISVRDARFIPAVEPVGS